MLQVMLISLGRNWGTGHLGPVALTGWLGYMPALLKSKDLFSVEGPQGVE